MGFFYKGPETPYQPNKMYTTIILELCRAHTPCAHCAICRSTFVCMHGYNFVNLRIVKMLFIVPVMSAVKKHLQQEDMDFYYQSILIVVIINIAILHYDFVPEDFRFQSADPDS